MATADYFHESNPLPRFQKPHWRRPNLLVIVALLVVTILAVVFGPAVADATKAAVNPLGAAQDKVREAQEKMDSAFSHLWQENPAKRDWGLAWEENKEAVELLLGAEDLLDEIPEGTEGLAELWWDIQEGKRRSDAIRDTINEGNIPDLYDD